MEGATSLVELIMFLILDQESPNFNFLAHKLFDIISNFNTLEKLNINICDNYLEREDEGMTIPLYKMFESLPGLEFLFISEVFISMKIIFYYSVVYGTSFIVIFKCKLKAKLTYFSLCDAMQDLARDLISKFLSCLLYNFWILQVDTFNFFMGKLPCWVAFLVQSNLSLEIMEF